MDVREIQPSRGASIIAADLGHHAESLDAVAGSEFVDDRIRLRESYRVVVVTGCFV
jgi:hypothetical protein